MDWSHIDSQASVRMVRQMMQAVYLECREMLSKGGRVKSPVQMSFRITSSSGSYRNRT
ncbi:hypothetical protein DSO57_1017352 [Entomophthora muscae]|uniref:Uncharacterized protein n=1 Tax=Entomophthora muscae TaxID=34485 RepID=A0ACC2SHY5_9FUNG|nr:hypothetical protein DSO57_1017352 [Entomophthora muscae]